jgi:hypothetical protein
MRRSLIETWENTGGKADSSDVANDYAQKKATSQCVSACEGADRTACIAACDSSLPESAVEAAKAELLNEVDLEQISEILLEAEVSAFLLSGKSELTESLINVPGFFIDKHELHYQPKVAAEDASEEDIEKIDHWNSTIAGEPIQDHTWTETKNECERAGKRLCSENEWEKACKGPSNASFSYGDQYQSGSCLPSGFTAGDKVLATAGCTNEWGALGMSGGVREWTSTGQGSNFVVKPGTIGHDAVGTRCAGRDDRNSSFSQVHIGGRCCADVPGSAATAPAEDAAAPAEDAAAPAEDAAAPAEDAAAPAEDAAAPAEDAAAPAEGAAGQ